MEITRLERLNKRAGVAKYKSGEILRTLSIQPGKTLADVGSGGGFYTYLFAKAVGPNGKVYAVDTDENNLAYIKDHAVQVELNNIETFLTPEDHLVLPNQPFDLIFMRNIFHHIFNPDNYFSSIANYVDSNSNIVIIDYKKVAGFSLSFASRRRHYSDPEVIVSSMQKSGLVLAESHSFLPNQSFQIFKRK